MEEEIGRVRQAEQQRRDEDRSPYSLRQQHPQDHSPMQRFLMEAGEQVSHQQEDKSPSINRFDALYQRKEYHQRGKQQQPEVTPLCWSITSHHSPPAQN